MEACQMNEASSQTHTVGLLSLGWAPPGVEAVDLCIQAFAKGVWVSGRHVNIPCLVLWQYFNICCKKPLNAEASKKKKSNI